MTICQMDEFVHISFFGWCSFFLFYGIKNTRCAWAGGTCANYPDFFENHQFHVIYCVTLAYVLFSKNF